MARVLIVGCGCRGRRLTASLVDDGHAVRGTTRDEQRVAEIAQAGGEGVVADPDRLGTLMPALAGVSVVCWLMGSAAGSADSVAALHGPRLRSMLEKLVDTPVRGIVYEASGTVSPALLADGAAAAQDAALTYRMPVRVVRQSPDDLPAWLTAMNAAVDGVLSD